MAQRDLLEWLKLDIIYPFKVLYSLSLKVIYLVPGRLIGLELTEVLHSFGSRRRRYGALNPEDQFPDEQTSEAPTPQS